MEFSYGDWVYLSDDLSDSINLNPSYNEQMVRDKAGKRLKIRNVVGSMIYRRGPHIHMCTSGYIVADIYVAEHEVMSCEEHRLLSKKASEAFVTGVTKLL
mgnify:FL=1